MNRIKVSIILSCLPALMVTMGGVIDGTSGTAFAFIMSLGMYFFSCWFPNKLVLQKFGVLERYNQGRPVRHQGKIMVRK